MNALNSQYGGNGFVVLGFPCNLFNKQEPGGNGEEIMNGITHVRPGNGFVPNFQIFEKIDVNGPKEHPLYTYLKAHCPPTAQSFVPDRLFYSPIKPGDITWNWESFLVDPNGKVLKRAVPSMDPLGWQVHIEAELVKNNLIDAVVG